VIITFSYKDNDNVPREVQGHCSTAPAVGDSVCITDMDDVRQEYKVTKKDWSFYSPEFNTKHLELDTDLKVTVTLKKIKNFNWKI